MTEISTFESWLAKGLGRPAVFLHENDATPYVSSLLYACSHDLRYDLQCEAARAPYLWRLLQLSHRQEFFRDAVLDFLSDTVDSGDEYAWPQLFGLARLFAAQDDEPMRRAMYSGFERLGFENAGPSSAQALIELDGAEGFLFAASRFNLADPENELWQVTSLISDLEERVGKEEAAKVTSERSDTCGNVRTVLDAARGYERRREQAAMMARFQPSPDYPTLRARAHDFSWGSELRRWAVAATPEQMDQVADDLVQEVDSERIKAYLRLFWRRPFPGSPDRLFPFADSNDARIKSAAMAALSLLPDPLVRTRALQLLHSADRAADGVTLLASNYEPGDFQLLDGHLQTSLSADALHEIGNGIKRIVEKYPTPEAERALLFLYENGPCSLCRHSFVEHLIHLGKLPEWMRKECLYDADSATIVAAENSGSTSQRSSS